MSRALARGALRIWNSLSLDSVVVGNVALPFGPVLFIKLSCVGIGTYSAFNGTLMRETNTEKLQQKTLLSVFVHVLAWHGKQFPCFAFWPWASNSPWHIWGFFFLLWNRDEDAELLCKAFSELQIKKCSMKGSWYFYSSYYCYSVCQSAK